MLVALGSGLAMNVRGSREFVIKRVASQSLGTLAPGYAASRTGMAVYGLLITSIGAVLLGLGAVDTLGTAGPVLAGAGVIAFIVLSVVAIAGEVRTYRALKR